MSTTTHEAIARRPSRTTRLAALLLAADVLGCGTVSPTLPGGPTLARSAAPPSEIVLVGDDALLAESERLLAAVAPVRRADATAREAALCARRDALVVRVTKEQPTFSSNAAERNTAFIYETAVVVGIPVTLISAVAWPWYGQMNVRGVIETQWCGGRMARTPAAAMLRVDGRGFIGWPRIKRELDARIDVALARKLVDAAAQCGRLERGKDLCVQP